MTYRTYAHTFPCGDATEAAGTDRAKSHEIIADDMADLERLVNDLEAGADWKEEIAGMIRRAHLRSAWVGLDKGEFEVLTAEVRNFNRLCLALGQSLRRAA